MATKTTPRESGTVENLSQWFAKALGLNLDRNAAMPKGKHFKKAQEIAEDYYLDPDALEEITMQQGLPSRHSRRFFSMVYLLVAVRLLKEDKDAQA